MNQAATGKKIVPAKMNIYTVLAVVATVALIIGIGFLWGANGKINGGKSPWYIEPKTADQNSVQPAAS